ncbi:MAG: peptide chain release factor 2 [Planctomycetota bacterium]
MDAELKDRLQDIHERIVHLRDLFDLDGKRKQLQEIEQQMAAPDFWGNKEKAQETVERLKELRQEVDPFREIESGYDDASTLLQLVEEEGGDGEALAEIRRDVAKLGERVERLEFRKMLAGKDDHRNAYLSIHAGAGGTESCDWASMLLRMYSRWLDRRGYKHEMVDSLAGDEAGLRRVTLNVKGKWAYGYLKSEIGVHRLVRISPFDSNNRRHTSFCAVDVAPEIEDDIEVEIKEADLRIDTYHASGAGGQHVNKTASAVRIVHIPTGILVACQAERSQHQNRRLAMNLLRAKLYQRKVKEREEELAAAYDEKGEIAWGHQIRSYVLQPYQMVKDLRTDVETGDVNSVLDGEIDLFIEAYLKQKIGEAK